MDDDIGCHRVFADGNNDGNRHLQAADGERQGRLVCVENHIHDFQEDAGG